MKTWILTLGLVLALCPVAFARVNVNTASEQELQSLPGVGEVRAKAIIDYRKKHGPFKSLEDLQNVKGIGAGTAKAIRDAVSFSGPSTPITDKTAKGEAKQAHKASANKAIADEKSNARARADDKTKTIAGGGATKGKSKDQETLKDKRTANSHDKSDQRKDMKK